MKGKGRGSRVDIEGAFRRARGARRALESRADTDCYRLFHGEADGLEAVTVDGFNGVAIVSLYEDWRGEEERTLVEAAARAFDAGAVYLKRRPREARVVATTQRGTLAPEQPAWGDEVKERVAKENGLRFLIRPGQGLSVGLYLDMRPTRGWVGAHARGQEVLNLFAYTCGLGLAALSGGAARAVNVDLSRRVLDWGEENLRLNGFTPRKEDFIAGDVFEWLRRLEKQGQRFTMVILDPPGFSTAGRRAFSASTQYARLVEAALPVLTDGGTLIAACNVAQLSTERFEAQVQRGMARLGLQGQLQETLGASATDFPVARGEEGALKVGIYSVRKARPGAG